MVDSIGNISNALSTQRSQAAAQTNNLRNVDVLNAVQQSQQKKSNAAAPVKIFAVPQSSKSGSAKVPRGSLVDVLT